MTMSNIDPNKNTNIQEMLDQTKAIATTTLDISQKEKANTRKIGVIGSALIEQKGVLSLIQEDQTSQSVAFKEYLALSANNQTEISETVTSLSDGLKIIHTANQTQGEFIETLSQLQIEHTKLVQVADGHAAKTSGNLEDIRNSIDELATTIENFDIVDQATFIGDKTNEILAKIASHVETRSEYQAGLSAHIDTLASGMRDFYVGVESQTEAISKMESIAEKGYAQVCDMNDKLDLFLELHNLKAEKSNLTLEELFTKESTTKESEVEELVEDDLFIDIPVVAGETVAQVLVDPSNDVFVDTGVENPNEEQETPDFFKARDKSINKDITPTEVAKKKRRFGIFGGK